MKTLTILDSKSINHITVRKITLYLLTSEERLKDLPSIYTEIPTD